jgi:hypothetical protein
MREGRVIPALYSTQVPLGKAYNIECWQQEPETMKER